MPLLRTFVYGAALLLCWGAGAVLLDRLLRDEPDPDRRRDAALGLGLVTGLLIAAFPGWLLSAVIAVPVSGAALPLAALAILGTLVTLRARLRTLFGRPVLVPAGVLLGILALFLFLRFGIPDIRQTEKPMDAAVLASLLTTPRIPLQDPWFAGARFPYYHFGTWLQALPARAAGLPVEYAYNLIAALLAALAGLSAFGAVRSRGGGRRLAVLAALFVVVAGTFDGLRQLLAGTPMGSIDPWPSSRRVANTITEWPLFTLWLGDLHPHAMSLPILVTLAGLAGRAAGVAGLALEGLVVAGLLSANPWDLPTALLLLAAGALATRGFRAAAGRAALGFACALPLLVPFLLSPRPPFQGIRAVAQKTTSPEAVLHFGGFLIVPALALGAALVRSRRRPDEALFYATLFPAIGIAVSVVTLRPVLGLASGALLATAYLLSRTEGAVRAGLLLAAAGTALVALPEVLAVVDPYGEQFHRMNTVFKTYAAAAPLFAIATALLLPLPLALSRGRKTVRVLVALALAGASVQPLSFFWSRARNLRAGSFDGLAWMSKEMPGDRAAIDWIRANSEPGAVIAEAVGGAYDDHGRIGTFSGRPTLLGWPNHEGLWRGDAGAAEVRAREEEIKTLYSSRDEAAVREVLRRRGIAFVVVGPLEHKDYGPDAFPLRGSFTRVFGADGTELFRAGGS